MADRKAISPVETESNGVEMVKDGHNPTCRHNEDFSKTQEQVQKKTQSFPLRVCDPALSIVLLSLHSSALEINIKADLKKKKKSLNFCSFYQPLTAFGWVGGWKGARGRLSMNSGLLIAYSGWGSCIKMLFT